MVIQNYFTLRDDEAICHCCQQVVQAKEMIDCNVCGKLVCRTTINGKIISNDCITLNHLNTQANVCTDCLLNVEKMMHYYASELVKAEEISAAKSIALEQHLTKTADRIVNAAERLMGDMNP